MFKGWNQWEWLSTIGVAVAVFLFLYYVGGTK